MTKRETPSAFLFAMLNGLVYSTLSLPHRPPQGFLNRPKTRINIGRSAKLKRRVSLKFFSSPAR